MQSLPEHCLVVPSANRWQLTTLSPRPAFCTNGFVCVPYCGPLTPQPLFFSASETVPFAPPPPTKEQPAVVLSMNLSRNEYFSRVRRILNEIAYGNVYEVNFCTLFTGTARIDPLSVFQRLYALSEAPYACMFRTGDIYVLSASPELFLARSGANLRTKPIKGTIRRGATRQEDERLAADLAASLKERTEHVMAVDVARNDLSRVAQKGSVTVPALYAIESFKTVHQMVSTVECRVRPEITFNEILAATFPMASMTGAPKLSAMHLINELEGFDRGFYSGAMGPVDGEGNFTLSVNIRCIVYDASTGAIRVSVGGAITALSDPQAELDECMLKARALLMALNAEVKDQSTTGMSSS